MQRNPLAGLKVLIVEDEFLIAQLLGDDLTLLGATVIGPFSRIAPALEVIDSGQPLEAAILDINIAGEEVYPLADALVLLGVNIVFSTGYMKDSLPDRFAPYVVLSKEAQISEIVAALS